jgi:hypothetical protein
MKVVLGMIVVGIFVACNLGGSQEEDDSRIHGVWKDEQGRVFEFKADSSGLYEDKEEIGEDDLYLESFNYIVDEENIYLIEEDRWRYIMLKKAKGEEGYKGSALHLIYRKEAYLNMEYSFRGDSLCLGERWCFGS